MEGLLLDPRTGAVEGRSRVPQSNEVESWQKTVERKLAMDRTREMLQKGDDYQNTTTTMRYLAYPAAAAGISRASNGAAAWGFSAYTEVVPVNTITSTFYIAGFTWAWMTPLGAGVDVTQEVLFELATGLAAAEVLIIQIPASYRMDTAVGYVPSNFVTFSEPKQIAANTRISVRVAQSLATTSQTYNGIKILYEMV